MLCFDTKETKICLHFFELSSLREVKEVVKSEQFNIDLFRRNSILTPPLLRLSLGPTAY